MLNEIKPIEVTSPETNNNNTSQGICSNTGLYFPTEPNRTYRTYFD